MSPKLVFHIGLEKTGSTSFQDYCARHRSELLKRSVLYPGNRLSFSGRNHAPLAASYFSADDARRLLIEPRRADRSIAVSALRREIVATVPDTVLISAEHFSSRFAIPQIQRLADDFTWADCRILIVARDHFARVLSAYATTIASGRDLTLDSYVDELCHADNAYLNHEQTIAPWEHVFGRDRVQIVGYSEGRDIVEILARQLIPSAPRPGRGARRLNVSPDASATEALRRINAGGVGASEIFRERSRAIVEGIRGAMGKMSPSRGQRGLSEDQRRRLNAIVEPDLRWLLSRGVSFDPGEPANFVRRE